MVRKKIIKMGKKGFSFNQLFKLIELAFLIIIILSFVFLTRQTVQKSSDTSSAEAYSYLQNILYGKSGILYFDPDIDRQYPEIILYDRFNDFYLDNSIQIELPEKVEKPAAKLTLMDNTGQVKEVYWNKLWFDRLYPKAGGKGRGSPYKLYEDLYVLKQMPDGKRLPSYLTIEMIVPKR
ncbi:hypothetical protein KY336_00795 [Candidatus Woesearchaeota archaeon]|nr:hypothetical protein [Candidatus Woesearchaeota archaeon]